MTAFKDLIGFAWKFIRRQKAAFITIFFLDSLAWPLEALIWPYILHLAIDVFVVYDAERFAAWQELQGPVIAAVCLVLFVEVAARTMGFLESKALPNLQADMRLALFDHIQHHSPRYFNERFAGSLANKITDMTTQVEIIFQQLLFPIVPALSTCILGMGFLWFVSPVFSWLLLFWASVHLSVCVGFARSASDYEYRHSEKRSVLAGKIVDSLTNNFAVNLFWRFGYEMSVISRFQQEEKKSNILARRYVEKMRLYLSLFYFFTVIFGIFGTVLYMWLHDHITTGQVIQVISTMWSLTMILWSLGASLPVLFQSFGIFKQAYGVWCDPKDVEDPPGAQEIKITKGEIVFKNVSFSYSRQVLFENKSVRIAGGEKVGLVGYSGAGKSTFVNLILRFFPLDKGKILIDGQDVSIVTFKSLRRNIALIPQEPLLFHRSLRNNILYGNPQASEQQMLHASKLAHCDEFIRQFPGKYEVKVGERGAKLSGGEKQRIAIARAILADAPILILDEATSSLDSVTEAYIQESLEKLMQNRTTIVIAHRLSTLSHMDRILVFDRGRIIEEGSHAALLERDGHYAKMWRMQVGGFLPEAPSSK